MKKILGISLVTGILALSCSTNRVYLPRWLHDKILKAERSTDSYTEIWAYRYKKQTVYLFLPSCCDKFSELYNEKGELICLPSGGITGKGDGRCNDFFKKRKDGHLLWKPQRTPID